MSARKHSLSARVLPTDSAKRISNFRDDTEESLLGRLTNYMGLSEAGASLRKSSAQRDSANIEAAAREEVKSKSSLR